MDEREHRLPMWARETLTYLRSQLANAQEPLARELAKLRPQVEFLKARYEAITELLEAAAAGKHKTAQEIMEVLKTYDLSLTKKEN